MKAEIKLTLPKEDALLLEHVMKDLKEVTVSKDISHGPLNVEFL